MEPSEALSAESSWDPLTKGLSGRKCPAWLLGWARDNVSSAYSFLWPACPVVQDGAQWGDVAHGLKNLSGFRSHLADNLHTSLFRHIIIQKERERENECKVRNVITGVKWHSCRIWKASNPNCFPLLWDILINDKWENQTFPTSTQENETPITWLASHPAGHGCLYLWLCGTRVPAFSIWESRHEDLV